MDFLGISFITIGWKHCNLLDGHSLNNRNSKVEKEDNKEMLKLDAKSVCLLSVESCFGTKTKPLEVNADSFLEVPNPLVPFREAVGAHHFWNATPKVMTGDKINWNNKI